MESAIVVSEKTLEKQTNYLLTYDLQQAVIDDLNERAEAVVVSNWQDQENYKLAKTLKSEINGLFKKIDRRRIDIRKFIDVKGKEVLADLEKPMKYLDSQMAIRDDEIARQKEEVEAKIQSIIKQRSEALAKEESIVQDFLLHPDVCTDEAFEKMLADARELKELRILKAEKDAEEAKAKDALLEAQAKEIESLKVMAHGKEALYLPVPSELTKVVLGGVSSEMEKVSQEFPDYVSALEGIIALRQKIEALQDQLDLHEAF